MNDKEPNLSKITDYESPEKLMAYAYQICVQEHHIAGRL